MPHGRVAGPGEHGVPVLAYVELGRSTEPPDPLFAVADVRWVALAVGEHDLAAVNLVAVDLL